ncbi:CPBP family intramembrane glutamic endopeptidase [Candidatus Contubernalis alkalaceticus]|uniref:CPBP family intramembrane glutamic endopeptidase n=1 Tax=Candidatus Contubernalis alkaliaceticus TaxID=338645 RepID=UPI00387EBECE|nr:CPBP family intramembrane metalloprotease [Candidatus Contubernalis alkalaceticus]
MIQVFARTGEELFFRGFLYTLIIKIFKHENKPWLWAIFLSSLLFALVHTQTFLPEYGTNMTTIFMIGYVLALLRKWTNSILPAIMIHVFVQSNILGVIFSVIIYYLFISISYMKKEYKMS